MRNYERLVHDCDSLVKAGQVAEAAKRLSGLNTAPVPREWRLPLANLCRRTGHITLGLKLLYRVIYPAKNRAGSQPPTSGELAEYGVLLHRFGSLAESVDVLDKVDPNEAPEALLFKAFCHFNEWGYEQAVPLLDRYVSLQSGAYQKFIGEVNLSAALVWCEKWDRALEQINRNIETAKEGGYRRLEGNSYELRAQVHIYRRNFGKARADLEMATQLVGLTAASDSLAVRKWQAIIESFEARDVQKLVELKERALAMRDGETAREADRFRLFIGFDEETFEHLLFGTPYQDFRSMLCRQMRRGPARSDYLIGGGPRCLDTRTGELSGAELSEELRAGGKCHKVIDVLLKDFYRPVRLGGLHSELFPGEHFNVFSSPGRVHQLLFRTREWLEANSIPIKIAERDGFYRIEVDPSFSVRIPYQRGEVDSKEIQWKKLLDHLPSATTFTAKEARNLLGIPRTSFQRLITWAEEEKKVERIGEYNTTSYRIAA